MTSISPTIRRLALAALLVAASLLAAACGGSGSHSHTSTHHSASTSTTRTGPGTTPASGTTTPSGTTPATGTASTTTSTTTAATPIATAAWDVQPQASNNGPVSHAQILIYDLRRQGPFLVLDFGLQCMSAQGCTDNLATDPHQLTSDAALDHQSANGSLSGIILVDPVNAVVYRAAEQDGWSDTSVFEDHTSITPAKIYMGWVRYRLPPTSVTSLDVAFPTGGPVFSNVPVSAGAAPALGPNMVAPRAPAYGPTFSTDSAAGLTLPVAPLTLTSGTDSQYTNNLATSSSIQLRGDVLFNFDKSNLTPRAHAVLTKVAADIKARAQGPIQVTGYTDDIGTQAFNLGLSRRRAASVVAALHKLTPGARFVASGLGESDPVASNKTATGRALNRRVTVSFAVKRPPPATPSDSAASTATSGSLTYASPAGGRYRLSIASAQREGQLLLAKLNITCLTRSGCQVLGDLGAGADTIPPQPYYQTYYPPGSRYLDGDSPQIESTNGFTLLDPDTGQVYLAARTDYVPLTSDFFPGDYPFGYTFQAWAYYPAPATSTTRLQLLAPVSGVTFKVHAAGRPEVTIPAG